MHRLKSTPEITTEERMDHISLVVLEMTDNTSTHAVALTENLIFDSNTTNALPRSIEGINCCCGANADFRKIKSGYVWKSNVDPGTWKGPDWYPKK